MKDLLGKVALVTGASSGIGEATALALAHKGVHLALVGRNASKLERVAAEARQHCGEVHVYIANLAHEEDVNSLKRAVEKDFDGLDILVNAAGLLTMGKVEDVPSGQIYEMFMVNALAPYALAHNFLPAIKRSGGDIVFINSRAGMGARPEIVAYCATKHALKAIADGLRAELYREGVRVISLYPGRVATEMQRQVHERRGQEYNPDLYMPASDIANCVIHALTMPDNFEVADVTLRSHGDTPS